MSQLFVQDIHREQSWISRNFSADANLPMPQCDFSYFPSTWSPVFQDNLPTDINDHYRRYCSFEAVKRQQETSSLLKEFPRTIPFGAQSGQSPEGIHGFDSVGSTKPQLGKHGRTSQNQQDKRRTREMNRAFCRLRTCLPEIPADTKLTKLKTLRMAISYIRTLSLVADSSSPLTERVSQAWSPNARPANH
nr:unnamed protein product [Spirometra erinaceieuropaei]